jgi:hypothetical protein
MGLSGMAGYPFDSAIPFSNPLFLTQKSYKQILSRDATTSWPKQSLYTVGATFKQSWYVICR